MRRTRVLTVDPREPSERALEEAAAVLRGQGLVAFPTETYYGLGADAREPAAVRRVFEVKRRPASKPMLVLVDSVAMAESLVEGIPSQARALMERHWPGPLTLVFRARPDVTPEVTAGTGTIGIRLPGHRLALGLVRVSGGPVTAPSANESDAPPPTTAAGVLATFDGRIELVLDGGDTVGGLPSTVVDVTVDPPKVLRAGVVEL